MVEHPDKRTVSKQSQNCLKMEISKKNQPVVDRLILLLSNSEAVADAILDNALYDMEALDPTLVLNLKSKLINIANSLDAAEQADLKPI